MAMMDTRLTIVPRLITSLSSLTPHPNQKSLLTAVEPLVLTQRDKDFFAALPLEDAKFSERFFADLQHSMVHGEIGTSTIQDLTKKMALQPTDEDICAQVMREVAQRRAKKERRFKPRAASAMEQRGKDSGAAPSTPSAPPQKSIAQRRFEEYIRERQELLQAEMDKKFKAKPVPASSLYKREEVAGTTSEEATATRDIRQRRRATTLGSMQSSLYLAQTDPATLKQKKFRAKEIPADVLNPPTISPEATELRQRKIKERALELLARSALPARMEKYAVTATATADDCGQHGKKKCRCPDPYADCTFHPRIRRDIPDYKALQAQFARSLEARRAQLSHGRKRAVSMGGASVPTVAEVQAQAASTTKTTDIKAITKPHRKPVLNAAVKKPAEAATSVVNGKEVAPVVVVDIAESASTNIFIEGANEPAHVEAIATPVPTKQSSMTLGRDTRSAQVKREYNRRLIEERERLKEEERKLLAERKARVKVVHVYEYVFQFQLDAS